jgi:peptidoglycan/LPS O-acetylase OafA/YrhL
MNLEPAWPYFILMALAMIFANWRGFAFLDVSTGNDTRYGAVDGLRGFLALGVFVCHLVVTQRYLATGIWKMTDYRFFALLGQLGVSAFFMLTGFLFWGKLLRSGGRPGWLALYIGRLFRIGPLYLAVVVAMLVMVFARTGFELRESSATLYSSVAQWLALGLIDTQPDVNGYPASHLLAGVTWTLWYEWVFYGSLVVTAWFARGRSHLLFVGAVLVVCFATKMLWHVGFMGFAGLFACGMLIASLLHEKIVPRLSDKTSSLLALLCMAAIVASAGNGYGTRSAVFLTGFVYLVCSGTSLFGLLATKPAQRLGKISYSLYLMHGLVLSLFFSVPVLRDFAMASAGAYWLAGSACGAVLIIAAAASYVGIEEPGIAWGKRMIRHMEKRRTRMGAPQTDGLGEVAAATSRVGNVSTFIGP